MKRNQQKHITNVQKQYGALLFEKEQTEKPKRLQRKNSENNTSRSKQIKFSKGDSSRYHSPFQPRFIRDKYIKQSEMKNATSIQSNKSSIKNSQIQDSLEKRRINSSQFQMKIHNNARLTQNNIEKLNQKNRFARSINKNQKQSSLNSEPQYLQLKKQYNQIKQQLKQSNIINMKQKEIIKNLQLKINSLKSQLQENEKLMLQKIQQIQLFNQKCFSKTKISQSNEFLKVEAPIKTVNSFSFIIDSVQKEKNMQFFIQNNQKTQQNICDISQQMQNLKLISNLNEKIKYQQVEIVMLKRLSEQLKDSCIKKDRQIRILVLRIKNITEKFENLSEIQKRNNKYYRTSEDQPSLTFSISIDSSTLIS